MQHSQLAPLPIDVPFRLVSKTIGQGAYACIKKAAPLQARSPIFAVKFIHKEYAQRHGKIGPKQLQMEVTLHKHIGVHDNIIAFYDSNEDVNWRWIAMELAEGGDLFDKIESDEGVGEDIAHFYFTQLISAVGYMHSKGIGHRDLKPENILLSSKGDLKIADFGLATLFEYGGKKKMSTTLCGSPPYIAPEVIRCSTKGQTRGEGYSGDQVDIWSCGVVLFVLLVGNTPWESPTEQSFEFGEYVRTKGSDELWQRLPVATLSLLRGMMKVDTRSRFALEDVRRHPWYTRKNEYISKDGKLNNPIFLATNMFESLHISFDSGPLANSQLPTSPDAMEVDEPSEECRAKFASTQPETPVGDTLFDWERPPRFGLSSTQPPSAPSTQSLLLADRLSEEPSMSQFSATPSVPLSRTQIARDFHDIVPSHSLTQFFSTWTLNILVPLIQEALHRLGVPVPPSPKSSAMDANAWIKVRTRDGRSCPLNGDIIVEVVGEGIVEINFVKLTGDPVEWRRFFKRVAVFCKDAVYKPDS